MRSFRSISFVAFLILLFTGLSPEGFSQDTVQKIEMYGIMKKASASFMGPPKVSSTYPYDGETNVPVDLTLTITFNQGINSKALNDLKIWDSSETLVSSIDFSISDGVLKVYMPTLKYSETYSVNIPSGVIQNALGELNNAYSFSFTTTDKTMDPLAVVSMQPSVDEEIISPDDMIYVVYSDSILGINLHDIYIKNSSGNVLGGVNPKIVGDTLKIEHNHFAEDTYNLTIPAGVVMNKHEVFNEALSFSFTVVNPPEVLSTDPYLEERGVELDRELTINFNEEVRIVEPEWFVIYDFHAETLLTDVHPYLYNPSKTTSNSGTADLSSKVIKISHETFSDSSLYFVAMLEGAVKNNEGGDNDLYYWYFETEFEQIELSLTDITPNNGETRVPVNTEISATFNQPIIRTTNFSEIHITDGSGATMGGLTSDIVDNKVHMHPPYMEGGETYTVYFPHGAVETSSGSQNDAITWSFTTIRSTPHLTYNHPGDSMKSVPIDTDIFAVFDQKITPADLSGVTLRDSLGNLVPGMNVTATDSSIEIAHDTLNFNERYYVEIPAGTVENLDGIGNNLHKWNFSTLMKGPQAIEAFPEDRTLGVSLDTDIYARFDQRIYEKNLAGITLEDTLGNILPEDFTVSVTDSMLYVEIDSMEHGKIYVIQIPEETVQNEDGVGNEHFGWGFMTILKAPEVVFTLPADSSGKAPVDTEIKAIFNQPVEVNDLGGVYIEDSTGTHLGGVHASFLDSTLVIDHDSLEFGHEYQVFIPAKAVHNRDSVGNIEFSWSFTTILESPELLYTVPEPGSRGNALDTEIIAGFNQIMLEKDLTGITVRDSLGNILDGVLPEVADSNLVIHHDSLATNMRYTVGIPEGAVQNADSLVNTAYQWEFWSIMKAPGIENFTPASGATGVALDAAVQIFFDQKVLVVDLSGVAIENSLGEVVSTGATLINGNSISITHGDFKVYENYTVTVPAGAVTNSDGLGNSSVSWSFETELSAPVAVSLFPDDGATRVPLDQDVRVFFNQDVKEAAMEGIFIRDENNNQVNLNAAVIDGRTLTITHDGFENGISYSVNIPEGAVENSGGLGNPQIKWQFRSVMAVPSITGTNPVSNAENIPLNEAISITFSQAITGHNLGSITLRDSDGNSPGGVSASINDNVLWISHNNLDYSTTYTVRIPQGAVTNADGLGNAGYSWSFSTIPDAPYAIALEPESGATGVEINQDISITFDQEVNAGNTNGIEITDQDGNAVGGVSAGINGNTLTLTHDALEKGQVYTVSVPSSSVVNTAGAGNPAISWMFRTIYEAPKVVSNFPADGAKAVDVDQILRLTYDKDINLINASGIRIESEDGTLAEGVQVALEETTLHISHDSLDRGRYYTVTVDADILQNVDGVNNSEYSWVFRTLLNPPLVMETVPFEDTQTASLKADIVVSFNMPVTLGDQSEISITDEAGNSIQNLTVTLEGSDLHISHDPFVHNTVHEVFIPVGVVKNEDDVPNDSLRWSFKTVLIISETVTVEVNRDFGSSSSATDYKLVAIPGEVNVPLNDVLPGEPNAGWQAYWDNGAEEDYLVRYDGSETFRLKPGNGFWVISTQALQYAESIPAVEMNEQNQVSIPLHPGWNIISNPLDVDVAWSDIERINNVNIQPVWAFEEIFSSEDLVFRSARSGEAFYFNNDQNLPELLIPYIPFKASTKIKEVSRGHVLSLNVWSGGVKSSISELVLRQQDVFPEEDVIAPPAGFEQASLRFVNPDRRREYSRSGKYARIFCEIKPEGAVLNMELSASEYYSVELSLEGWHDEFAEEIVLIDKNTGISYPLSGSGRIKLPAGNEIRPFLLVMGSSEMISEEQQELLPEQVEIHPNYPNPFNPETTIAYSLPERAEVNIAVYDMLGRRISTIINNEFRAAGKHAVRFNANGLASGMYVAVIEIGNRRFLQKMLLMK